MKTMGQYKSEGKSLWC